MDNNSQLSSLNSQLQNRSTVLLVEDNKELNDGNSQALRLRGYNVLSAETLAEARAHLCETEPDVILLDVMLPDGDGFDFCEEIQDKTNAHIIFLTGKTAHEDRVRGISGGGDNYITKPFILEEMLVMVDAAIRRRTRPPDTIAKGNLTLNITAMTAQIGGVDLLLKPKEFALLKFFVQHESHCLTPEYIYEKVWNQHMNNDTGAVRFHVSKLRKKLENSGYTIINDRGGGYRFERN